MAKTTRGHGKRSQVATRAIQAKRPGREALKAPFPWFGGKSRVAWYVWQRFGRKLVNYVEPFAGSLATLLCRPTDDSPPRVHRNETVNDLDCWIANFWRAVRVAPDLVAFHADLQVNEADLHARHKWLHSQAPEFRQKMHGVLDDDGDPDFCDPKIAGWWVWGISCWIGDGWCRTELSGMPDMKGRKGVNRVALREGKRPHVGKGGVGVLRQMPAGRDESRFQCSPQSRGVHAQRAKGGATGFDNTRPSLHPGQGVHAKGPQLGGKGFRGDGTGLEMKRPCLDAGGRGVGKRSLSQQIPSLTFTGGVHATDVRVGLYAYMARLCERLRYVRVCCGDWSRVVAPSVTWKIGTTAVFLDPPYGDPNRDRVYGVDSREVAGDVLEWCLANGDNDKLRIALCGYVGEHDKLEGEGWDVVAWNATGGYAARNLDNDNGARERIWLSPHCLPEDEQVELFPERGHDDP